MQAIGVLLQSAAQHGPLKSSILERVGTTIESNRVLLLSLLYARIIDLPIVSYFFFLFIQIPRI